MNNDIKIRLLSLFEEVFKAGCELKYDEYSIENSDIWDSLAMIEIVLKIEKNFGVSVSSKDLEKFYSFKNIYMFLNEYKK